MGTSHPSVTDVPLIEPLLLGWTTGASIDAMRGVREYVDVSADFMHALKDGERRNVLARGPTHPERPGEGVPGASGPWLVHVAPPATPVSEQS